MEQATHLLFSMFASGLLVVLAGVLLIPWTPGILPGCGKDAAAVPEEARSHRPLTR